MEIIPVKHYAELAPRKQHQVDAFLFIELVEERIATPELQIHPHSHEELVEHIANRREELAADIQMQMPVLYDYGDALAPTMKALHHCLAHGAEDIAGERIDIEDVVALLDMRGPGRSSSNAVIER